MKAEVTMRIEFEGSLTEAADLLEAIKGLGFGPSEEWAPVNSPPKAEMGTFKVPGPTEEEIPF